MSEERRKILGKNVMVLGRCIRCFYRRSGGNGGGDGMGDKIKSIDEVLDIVENCRALKYENSLETEGEINDNNTA